MADLTDFLEKWSKINRSNKDCYALGSDILSGYIIDQDGIDLYKLCSVIGYFAGQENNEISLLSPSLSRTHILDPNQALWLTDVYQMFDNDDLIEFYKGKFVKSENIRYKELFGAYEETLGKSYVGIRSVHLSYILQSRNLNNIQQLNHIVNVFASQRIGNPYENIHCIKLFIIARRMGYDSNLIVKKFGITKEQHNIITNQNYYDFLKSCEDNSKYEQYISILPVKEFAVAAASFIAALRTNIKDLKGSSVTIPAELIQGLIEMPGYKTMLN